MKGITLFIFGGVAEMCDEPSSPKAEFMMAIVGPLSSIAIALIFYGLHVAGKGALAQPVSGVIKYLASINGILAVFNLVPAFPLDGGRVLRSILWGIKGNLRQATRISSSVGSAFGVFLILVGFLNILRGNFVGGMWWFLIGMFVQGAAKASYQQLLTRKALEGEPLSRFMNADPVTVPASVSVDQLVEDYIYRFHYKMFPVVENGDRLIGCVTTNQVKELSRDEWDQKKMREIARDCTDDNTISSRSDAVEALSAMRRNGSSRMMVVDEGKLVGIISLKDMMKWLSLKMDLEG
jgi:CBS domain-containing protein